MRALELGVNFIDTADVYGYGHSEKLIASVLREYGRDGVVVATKAGNDFYNATPEDDTGYGPIRLNGNRDYIIFAAEQSLRRLGVECLDLLQLHSLDSSQLESEEPWLALRQLKEQGKIRWAGISVKSFKDNEQAPFIETYSEFLDCVQVRYNLLERRAEDILFPLVEHLGIGVIVRIPLLFGLLTGKFARGHRFSEDDHRSFNLSPGRLSAYLDELEELEPLFQRWPDQTRSQVSLRFCFSHSACTTVIPGCRTVPQVEENCAADACGPFPERWEQELDKV